MSNSNPSPATRFKAGNPGGGRPKGLLTKPKVQAVMSRFADLTKSELDSVIENPKSTMLEIMIAAVMIKAARDGDYNRLSFLLDRTVGRVTEEITINEFEQLSDAELLQLVKENMPEIA